MSTFEFIKGKAEVSDTLPLQIPNVSRYDLAKWFRELDFKTGVEVGVAAGEYSKVICDLNPQLMLYGVDSYKAYDGYGDYKRESTFTTLRDTAYRSLKTYIQRGRYEMLEDTSMRTVKTFEDGMLDFVYLDANHQEPYITQDIEEWTKKVKPGGIIAGHDYATINRVKWDVKEAVKKYTKAHNITWFVLGLDELKPGLVREGSRTWLFVKQ